MTDKMIAVPRELLEALVEILDRADTSEGYCCCGDSMQNHPSPMYCGHSPVDVGDYYAGQRRDELKALLSEAAHLECCGNPAQCWEPCGDLGKSAEHARPADEDAAQPEQITPKQLARLVADNQDLHFSVKPCPADEEAAAQPHPLAELVAGMQEPDADMRRAAAAAIQQLYDEAPKVAAPAAEELRRDAERYRWLRARCGRIADEYDGDSDQLVAIREADSHFEGWGVDPASLDRAIDTAIAAEKKKEG